MSQNDRDPHVARVHKIIDTILGELPKEVLDEAEKEDIESADEEIENVVIPDSDTIDGSIEKEDITGSTEDEGADETIYESKNIVMRKPEGSKCPVIEIINFWDDGKSMIIYPVDSFKRSYMLKDVFDKWELVRDAIIKTIKSHGLDPEDYFLGKSIVKFEVKDKIIPAEPIKLEIVKDLDITFESPDDLDIYWIEEIPHDARIHKGTLIPSPKNRKLCTEISYNNGTRKTFTFDEIEPLIEIMNEHNLNPSDYFFGKMGETYRPENKNPCFAFIRNDKNLTISVLRLYFNKKMEKLVETLKNREEGIRRA